MTRSFLSVANYASTSCSLSPSLLYNNLSFVDKLGVLVYASKKDCVIRDITTHRTDVLPISSTHKETIVHCTATLAPRGLLHAENAVLIFITTATSSQLWSVESQLGRIVHSETGDGGCCGAIVSWPSDAVHMVVGTSKGAVFFAECDTTPGTPFRVHPATKGHMEHAVTAARLSPFHDLPLFAVTGDSVGSVLFWNRDRQAFLTVQTSECVTALQIVRGGDLVVAANGAGKLHVLDSRTGDVKVEVCAHSRWIYVLALNSAANQLMSAAEDGYVTVWSVGETTVDGIVPIEPVATHHTPHVLPTGAAFMEENEHILLAMYDTEAVTEFVLV